MIHFTHETFHLATNNTSYIFKILPSKQPVSLYYGRRIAHRASFDALYQNFTCAVAIETQYSEKIPFLTLNTTRLEFSTYGKSDYREPTLHAVMADKNRTLDFLYSGHTITEGKAALSGVPHFFQNNDTVDTLTVTLTDSVADMDVRLIYNVFEDKDIITRHMEVVNRGESIVTLQKVMSFNLDFPHADFDLVSLTGHWIREKYIQRSHLQRGVQSIESKRLLSGAEHNPFMALVSPQATETTGDCYGFGLVYSGNHKGNVEVSGHDITRIQMGISDFDFEWALKPGESFTTPEAVLVFSHQGLNGMSQIFHRAIRENLIPKPWQYKERPIVFNSWEAMYFDYDEDKLLKLAKAGKALGMELFVLDDGWFKGRNDDTSSLGDWVEDSKKLPNGLNGLRDKIAKMDLQFGLWVEPEMVSPNSDLAKAHPEWIVGHPDRERSLGRNQLMLDLANPQVTDYLYEVLSDLYKRAKVDYVKWDCNRSISDIYSDALTKEEQMSFAHRYYLGFYQLLDRLKEDFPHVLFESCASGGNRHDLGMLYYMPQTWASDDSDPGARMKIQHGATLFMPPDTIAAHVGSEPSHQVLRRNDIETRFDVACFGSLGYELNLMDLSKYEKNVITQQTAEYKRVRKTLQFGDFYRIKSPFETNNTIWMAVNSDKTEAVLGYFQTEKQPNNGFEQIRLLGLDETKTYRLQTRPHFLNIEKFGDLINRIMPVHVSTHGVKGIAYKTLCENYMYKGEQQTVTARGDELMYAGFRPYHHFIGSGYNETTSVIGDHGSRVYYITETTGENLLGE